MRAKDNRADGGSLLPDTSKVSKVAQCQLRHTVSYQTLLLAPRPDLGRLFERGGLCVCRLQDRRRLHCRASSATSFLVLGASVPRAGAKSSRAARPVRAAGRRRTAG
jgi:hypothetical protein